MVCILSESGILLLVIFASGGIVWFEEPWLWGYFEASYKVCWYRLVDDDDDDAVKGVGH